MKVTSYDSSKMIEELKDIARDFVDDYGIATKLDYQKRKTEAGPGDVIPVDDGLIHTDVYKAQVASKAREAKKKATEVMERYNQIARDEMTETPDQNALAYIRAMSERSYVDPDEIAEAFEKFGDNWTCYVMLKDQLEERQKTDRAFFKVDPTNTLDNFKKINAECVNSFNEYIQVAETARLPHSYLNERLETLDTSLFSIADGGAGMPIARLMSHGGWMPGFANSALMAVPE